MISNSERQRYSRHLLLGDIGEEGQQRLLRSRVLIVGLGGLGSPVALYLASAGVGQLLIADGDALEVSNLQRQILYDTAGAGESKVRLAEQRLSALNPDIELNVADDPEATEQALLKAAAEADCILSSGGVSVGEEDHVKACVDKLGSLDLWRVAIKPGKPLAYGHVRDVPFIGLPGNPVSVFVTFAITARPYLLKTQGASDCSPLTIPVVAGFSRPNSAKRQEYLRARLVPDDQGRQRAELAGSQSSGVLSSVCRGDGLVIHKLGEAISEGDQVLFLPFPDLLY